MKKTLIVCASLNFKVEVYKVSGLFVKNSVYIIPNNPNHPILQHIFVIFNSRVITCFSPEITFCLKVIFWFQITSNKRDLWHNVDYHKISTHHGEALISKVAFFFLNIQMQNLIYSNSFIKIFALVLAVVL